MIIIARYNEDISWTEELTVPFIIYNKGKDEIPNSIRLNNNPGKEADTYLSHIITNYDKLEGDLYFLQANPFDHMERSIVGLETNGIDTAISNKKDILNFLNNFTPQENFMHLGPIYGSYISGSNDGIQIVIDNFFIVPPILKNNYYYFTQGAQFIVSAERIKEKPLQFYINVYNYINNVKPIGIGAHIMERLWMYIFSSKTK